MNRDNKAGQKERYWRRHSDSWTRSGLSQREYCDQHGLATSTFQLWRRRLGGTGSPEPSFDIVPVAHVPRVAFRLDPQPLVLVIDGGRYRVEVGEGTRMEALQVLLDALEGRR